MDESNVLGGWEEAADAENAAIDAVAHSEEQHDRVRRGATTIETALSTAELGASASGKLIRTLTSTPPLVVVPAHTPNCLTQSGEPHPYSAPARLSPLLEDKICEPRPASQDYKDSVNRFSSIVTTSPTSASASASQRRCEPRAGPG